MQIERKEMKEILQTLEGRAENHLLLEEDPKFSSLIQVLLEVSRVIPL